MTALPCLQDPCFDPDTLVLGRFGSQEVREIRYVKPGDWVLARNVATGEQAFKRVIECFKHVAPLFKIYYADSGGEVDLPVLTTTSQLFWVANAGWTAASELLPGMNIRSHQGVVIVADAYDAEVDSEAFSITVEDFHSFFAGPNGLFVRDRSQGRPIETIPGRVG